MDSTLTHWGRVTHICVSKLTIIGSDNGLSPGRRQAIIWTNDGILLIWTFRTHFNEIVSEIHTFSFKKMHFKMSSGKWRPSCLGLNVLIKIWIWMDRPFGTSFNENSDQNFNICIKNAFESVVCEMAAILSLPQCVKCVYCGLFLFQHLYQHIKQKVFSINKVYFIYVYPKLVDSYETDDEGDGFSRWHNGA